MIVSIISTTMKKLVNFPEFPGWINVVLRIFVAICLLYTFLGVSYHLIKFLIAFISKIIYYRKDTVAIKSKLTNSTIPVKRGIAFMFYSKGHCYELHISRAPWMIDLKQRGLIFVTNNDEIWTAHFKPKVLKILSHKRFEKTFFQDCKDIKLQMQVASKEMQNHFDNIYKNMLELLNKPENKALIPDNL